MKRHLFLFVFLFGTVTAVFSQNIIYSKSTFAKSGDPGTSVTPDVSFLNSDSDTIEVLVVRFYKNLPANWTSCFCFLSCHPPTEDTLHFFVAPSEKIIIGVGFNTDTIPGTGYVKITVEQIGGTQKDTLSFSGSTLQAGMSSYTKSETFKLYPNPVSDKLIINSEATEINTIKCFDMNGKLLKTFPVVKAKKHELSLGDLPCGEYLLQLSDPSGKTETKKIIKN
jgi:hypothetical protein